MVDVVVDVFGGRRDGAQVVADLVGFAGGQAGGSGLEDGGGEAGDEVDHRSPSCRRNALGCGRRG